jgi:tetratricopeptide (TPR) repeat protein
MNKRARLVIQGTLIVLVVFLAYLPALRAGFIWDDDAYVTNNSTLHDLGGLRRIWFEVGAVPQYYPMVHTTFWLEYHLWGLHPVGYHLINVLLHATAAILLWQVLLRLRIRGAWLAAVLFALHPVCVESVAWITERKNVLSAVFYFTAALAYRRFVALEEPGGPNRLHWYWYLGALVLFLAALLSKTVTCSLPAALLLVCWWKKGRVQKGEILPLLPFFALGLGLGLMTAWIEKFHVGAQGTEWSLTFADRCLIAGRALWFYAGKLVWPAQLTFIYPRWEIEPEVWWPWLYPVAAVCVVAGLWLARRRIGRGPLVAVLFFAGTLGPALGFVNVYPMRYSFVADHFQYLASVGLIALCAAGLNRIPRIVPATVVVVLGVLTWRQASVYRNLETLWRDTLAKNPDCSLAHNNLGVLLVYQGRIEEAMEHYHKAVQTKPNYSEALYNLGIALANKGRFDEAIENYRKAIQFNPNNFEALNNLGSALAARGRFNEAIENYYKAIQINPNFSEAQYNLGNALAAQGRFDEAIGNYYKAIQINPNNFEAQYNLGNALAAKGRFDEAIESYRMAIQINPNCFEALNNLGVALAARGRFDEAIENYYKAIQINPNFSEALDNLGVALATKGRFDEAIENYRQAIQVNPNRPETFFHLGMTLGQLGRTREAVAQYREALRLNPNLAGALNKLAWALATSPEDELRNGAEAVRLAERACELTHYGEPFFIGTLAAAYAESGRFPEAVTTAEKAEQLASKTGLKDLAGKNRQLLELYRAGKSYREPRSASPTNLTTNSVPSATASSFSNTPTSRTGR